MNNKVLVETKDLKQYFPTGRRRNESKVLNQLKSEILELYRKELADSDQKLTFKHIIREHEEGKISNENIKDLIEEYNKVKEVHKEKLYVKANDGINLKIHEGETVGLVGESGCGKSTLGRAILKLYSLTAGKVLFDGNDITDLSVGKMKELRQDMQIIFQDPYSSLNPRMTVGQIIGEALVEQGLYQKGSQEWEDYVKEIMKTCGLDDYMIYRFPHEFSGGQRQRIGIARALALKPRFIVCDEAVSALDVSIQSQVINLLQDLQKDFGLSYLFISHDLSVVKHISDRIGVMYLGDIVELADKRAIYNNPQHPYTKALLSAIPVTNLEIARNKKRIILEGDIPSNVITPTGCKFHTRCPIAKSICKTTEPEWREVEKDHFVSCHYAGAEVK
ncbi:ATP-binding cassette domain-containing protein [Mycoplasmatota bacterium]|nr:ATP-binding cassette domain-containing protein [Mycoplasmatota bacterium]